MQLGSDSWAPKHKPRYGKDGESTANSIQRYRDVENTIQLDTYTKAKLRSLCHQESKFRSSKETFTYSNLITFLVDFYVKKTEGIRDDPLE